MCSENGMPHVKISPRLKSMWSQWCDLGKSLPLPLTIFIMLWLENRLSLLKLLRTKISHLWCVCLEKNTFLGCIAKLHFLVYTLIICPLIFKIFTSSRTYLIWLFTLVKEFCHPGVSKCEWVREGRGRDLNSSRGSSYWFLCPCISRSSPEKQNQ